MTRLVKTHYVTLRIVTESACSVREATQMAVDDLKGYVSFSRYVGDPAKANRFTVTAVMSSLARRERKWPL